MSGISDWFPAGPPIGEEQQVGRLPFIEGLEQRMLDADKVKLLENRRTGTCSSAAARRSPARTPRSCSTKHT